MIQLAVFGQPISQSLSPRIHGLFADLCDIEIDYQAIEASLDSFPDEVAKLAAAGGRGCNITVPLKHEAWRLADRSSPGANRARAANTLLFSGPGDWYADSTDGRGLVNDLRTKCSGPISGSRICLLGAGGAAASVLAALLEAGPACVVIVNRTIGRARELARAHSDLGAVESCAPGEVDSKVPFDLVINATSLGHEGKTPTLSKHWFGAGSFCYDMNYGQASVPLQRLCEAIDIPFSDGLGMLVGQAALSFELWTGRSPETGPVLKQLRQTPG